MAAHVGLDPATFVPFAIKADGRGLRGWRVWIDEVRRQFDLVESNDDLYRFHEQAYFASFVDESAVRNALADLRDDGWQVAVVTNGASTQDRKVDLAGLRDVVDVVVVSEVVGVRKPDPRMFALACEQAGVDCAEVMVGDNPAADIGGAHAAGIASIWIDHGYGWPPEIEPPTHSVKSITDAIALVRTL